LAPVLLAALPGASPLIERSAFKQRTDPAIQDAMTERRQALFGRVGGRSRTSTKDVTPCVKLLTDV
jgi:hypothetical protein